MPGLEPTREDRERAEPTLDPHPDAAAGDRSGVRGPAETPAGAPVVSFGGSAAGANDTTAPEGTNEAELASREHEENLKRLRTVLGIGVVLWSVVGIPNDMDVTRTFALSYREFTIARIVSTLFLLLGWLGLFLNPGPRGLRACEMLAFVSTSAGLAGLNHGLGGPTPNFLSCALLAQGVAMPRHWRVGIVSLGATWAAYPVAFALHEWGTRRNAAQWGDASLWSAMGFSLVIAACTCALLVVGGHYFWLLRRQAFAERQVGRYRLRERIFSGAMGEVWRALHPGLGSVVALKIAHPRAGETLAQEAEILGRLSHPNTVRVVDRGVSTEGLRWYAMEYVEGETLAKRVAREGAMEPERAVGIGVQLARALGEVHRLGVVHRDVKPANVMVSEVGGERDVVKLVDFGGAVALRAEGAGAGASAGGATGGTGAGDSAFVGSLGYMAPEQREGAAPDARMDVFALGATVFFALTGKSPMEDDDGRLVPRQVAEGAWESRLPRSAGDGLRAVLRRCLAASASERYGDANEAASAFEACVATTRASGAGSP